MAYEIEISDRYVSVTLDASDAFFDTDFPVMAADEVEIWRTRGGTRDELTLDVDYTITNLDQLPGARVNLSPVAAQDDIYEAIGLRQPKRLTDYADGNRFNDTTLNAEFDRLAIQDQEQRRDIGRSLKSAYGQAGLSIDLSAIAPGQTLMLGADNEIVSGPTADEISNAQGYAILTAADRVQTGLDRIAAAGSAAAAAASAAAAAQKFLPVNVLDDGEGDPDADYEAGDTIDGVTLAAGMIVLRATDGGDPLDGPYAVPPAGAAPRFVDFAAYDDLPGAFFSVKDGSSYADTLWRCTSNDGGELGTTDIVIAEYRPRGGVAAAASHSVLRQLDNSASPAALLTTADIAGHFVWDGGDLSPILLGGAINSSAVSSGTNTVTSTAHLLKTGDAFIVTAAVNGLSTNRLYYARFVDVNNFKVCDTYNDAIAGTAISLTAEDAMTVKRHYDPLMGVYVTPEADITGSSGARVRKRGGDIEILWFGADATGATYSTQAVQCAVDLAARYIDLTAAIQGYTVDFPSGAIRLEGVRVNHAIHLRGKGWYQTRIINASTNVDAFYFGAIDPTTTKLAGCGISGMYIQYVANDPTLTCHGVRFDRCRDCFALDLKIVNHFHGIGIYGGGETILIDRCDISAGSNFTAAASGSTLIYLMRRQVATGQGSLSATDGLYYDHPVSVYISNCNLRGPATTYRVDYGIYARCFDGLYLTNIHCGLTEQACIRFLPVQANISLINLLASSVFVDPLPGTTDYGLWYSLNGSENALIRNHRWTACAISGAINDGVAIQGNANTNNIKFTACNIANNGRHGISVTAGAEQVGVVGCDFYSNNLIGSGHHVNLANASRAIIANNNMSGSSLWCVIVAAPSSRTSVLGNIFEDYTSGGLSDSSATTTAANNVTI